jgi:hypothetical protein
MEEVNEVNPFDPAQDFFGELKDYKPEEIKDEGDFKPLKGSYITRVTKLTHNIGVSTTTNEPYDFYALNMQITDTVDGDKGNNRYLNKRYQNTNEKLKALMNDLFTAGIPFDTGSREAFDLSLVNAIDKQVRLRAWSWTPEKDRAGNPIAEENRTPLQQMKIVKDFTKKGKGSSDSTAVPF